MVNLFDVYYNKDSAMGTIRESINKVGFIAGENIYRLRSYFSLLEMGNCKSRIAWKRCIHKDHLF